MKATSGMAATAVAAEEFGRLVQELHSIAPVPRSVLVTGVAGGEGATTVAAHLALALAQRASGPVLLVDANLRDPGLQPLLGADGGTGWLEWDRRSPIPAVAVDAVPRLFLVAAAAAGVPLPARLPAEQCEALAKAAATAYEHVVWDAPAVASGPEAASLAVLTDGVILVVEMDRTRADVLDFAGESLERAGARLLGAVANRSGRYWPFRTFSARDR